MLIKRSAVFSPCGTYRLRLERDLGVPGLTALGLMVNPSKAGAEVDDHTIRKWYGFAPRHDIGRFIIANKFAHVATDVKELRFCVDAVGPDNDKHIEQAMRDADVHIVAWGPLAKLPPNLRTRWREVVAIADRVGCKLMCFGTAQDGHPRHPLMLAYNTPLVPWIRPALPSQET